MRVLQATKGPEGSYDVTVQTARGSTRQYNVEANFNGSAQLVINDGPPGGAEGMDAPAYMRVGDFGLGAILPPVYPLADLDADPTGVPVGQYRIGSTLTNNVVGFGVVHVSRPASDIVILEAKRDLNGGRFWWRAWRNGDWGGPWQQSYHTLNILGTVTQSGGTPTGALIERGSNANGDYIRFADGTQICWRASAITTDPAAFAGTPVSLDGDKLRIGRWF